MKRDRKSEAARREYLLKDEVDALLRHAPHARARLLFLLQWRAGLRVSEALAIEVRDLDFDKEAPTLLVRSGKFGKSRRVPMHAELVTALRTAIDYADLRDGALLDVSRVSAWRWIQSAYELASSAGLIASGRQIGNHTLRHSFARHQLHYGTPVNELQRWMGHENLSETLLYLELTPDPGGTMEKIP